MITSTVEEVVLDEKIWDAWVLKGKRSDQATGRILKIISAIAFVLLALAGAFFMATA
ncbi:MAG TPA: hypothetical protein VM120_14830 [Bryobacteraceae bacterium]|nr:hypothetical protein [Bryobacteraceae bacterium]